MHFERTTTDGALRVRSGRPEDAIAIQVLYQELLPGDAGIHVLPERVTQIAEDPNTLLLVVEAEGIIIGSALVTFCLDAMYRAQPFGMVENVIVTAAARLMGVGRMLMEAINTVAAERDYSKLMLLSNAQRLAAHDFFTKCGFDGTSKKGFVKYRKTFQPGSSLVKGNRT